MHFDDIKVDHDVLSSHIAAFAETCLCFKDDTENYSIPFSVIKNNQNDNNPNRRPPHCLIVYIKQDFKILNSTTFSDENLDHSVPLCKNWL